MFQFISKDNQDGRHVYMFPELKSCHFMLFMLLYLKVIFYVRAFIVIVHVTKLTFSD